MKRISRNIKYIATIILCFVVIGLNINFLHAIDGIDASETGNITESPIIDIDLNPIISSPVVDINTPVRVSFDNADVLSYSVETDGLIATEVTNGSMEYDIVATGEFGTMNVYATYSGDIVKKSSVYTYKANNKVYISDISKDQAWYEWIEEYIDESLEYLGEFTADIAQELYYELCGGYTEEYAPQYNELLSNDTVPGKTVVQGKLFWQEDSGTHHKLICHNCNGEETLIAHDFEYTSVDATYHTKICAYCGYSETKGHVFEYKNMGDYHILACKECGRTSGSPQNHSWSPANIGNIGIIIDDCVKCQFCGCLKILGPGEFIPVIKGIKPEIEE